MQIGTHFLENNLVEFRAFSSEAEGITLHLGESTFAMEAEGESGFFRFQTEASTGFRYGYSIDGGPCYPDPASRFQPDGVHEKSELVDISQLSTERPEWNGLPFRSLIIYELHIGTFTEEGTYQSAIEQLDELVCLGVTALELMPLAQASGNWNWGYDGVNLFAPANAYGRPEDLIAFIDAAHKRGLAVILDVVYNHFGPEGNYLFAYEGFLSQQHTTPWGDAPNFDGESSDAARAMILENARYWIEDYGFDGLRVDATHFIKDTSAPHIVTELGSSIRTLETKLNRPLHLIGETNVFDADLIKPENEGGSDFDGLWCDELLHSCYAQLRPDEAMTPRTYNAEDFGTVLQKGYVYHGSLTNHYGWAEEYDQPPVAPMEKLVCSLQNHDFIGNHPDGIRIHNSSSLEAQRAAASLLFLLPSVPMIFMGEEFSCDSPFYFFVDFHDERLRRAVERGRKRDHPQHDWSKTASPVAAEAFLQSKIGPTSKGNAETLRWYKTLIQCRKDWQQNGLLSTENLRTAWDTDHDVAILRYQSGSEERFLIARLHAKESAPSPIKIQTSGAITFSQHYEAIDESNGIAEAFAVVAGSGAIRLIDDLQQHVILQTGRQ